VAKMTGVVKVPVSARAISELIFSITDEEIRQINPLSVIDFIFFGFY
jgi:hypothetical protein